MGSIFEHAIGELLSKYRIIMLITLVRPLLLSSNYVNMSSVVGYILQQLGLVNFQ